MPRKPAQEDVDKDHASIVDMAKRLGLSGETADDYVHKHMTKLGHQAKRVYTVSDEDGEKGKGKSGDDWF